MVAEMSTHANAPLTALYVPTQSASRAAKTTRPLGAVAAPMNLFLLVKWISTLANSITLGGERWQKPVELAAVTATRPVADVPQPTW